MFSRKPLRLRWTRTLALAVVVLVSFSTGALAAGFWTDIIGTSGNDTINESGKPGNFRILGLLGKDKLTGGLGTNVLVGDGHCPPGATDVDYCDFSPIPGDGGDTLTGGPGSNGIFGGGGPNVLIGGGGHNFIQAGPATNTITGGPSGDAIQATVGTSTITAGKGMNVIDARSPGKVNTVICTGKNDFVYAFKQDVIKNCAHVFISTDSRDRANATAAKMTHRKTVKKHTVKRVKHTSSKTRSTTKRR